MKLASIVGARPQFIKAAVVSAAWRDIGIEEELVDSGRHYPENVMDFLLGTQTSQTEPRAQNR